MTVKKIAILGASGHGKVVAELAELNGYSVAFFDDAYPQKSQLEQWSVIGNTDTLIANIQDFDGVAIGIGNNRIRAEKSAQLDSVNAELISLVHPSATVSNYSVLGKGVAVMAGAVINPFATIGDGVIVNTCAVVEHDCLLGDFSHVSPNAALAGESKIGHKTWIGIGASVRQQIKIGDDSVIGAGSVVVKDIPAGSTVCGNPAKEMKR